eukprot:CAMPEP_0194534690 /NCGR_PEP_ID=MMETSP0253-20130528/72979_1 /TAXON_ID=2966 /ORGANISM="Noctiluca scintillans" /LENGTH=227 /DNA_ID=CAMNT_0039380387 /DNA_START=9 /DNA_END=690 /DNA_ORIENTATION=+
MSTIGNHTPEACQSASAELKKQQGQSLEVSKDREDRGFFLIINGGVVPFACRLVKQWRFHISTRALAISSNKNAGQEDHLCSLLICLAKAMGVGQVSGKICADAKAGAMPACEAPVETGTQYLGDRRPRRAVPQLTFQRLVVRSALHTQIFSQCFKHGALRTSMYLEEATNSADGKLSVKALSAVGLSQGDRSPLSTSDSTLATSARPGDGDLGAADKFERGKAAFW